MDNPPLDIDLREKLAHIDQMLADHDRIRVDRERIAADRDRKLQEMRVEPWKTAAAVLTALAILFGAIGGLIGFQLGNRPPSVIVQIPDRGR